VTADGNSWPNTRARRPSGSHPLTRKPSPDEVSRETPEGPLAYAGQDLAPGARATSARQAPTGRRRERTATAGPTPAPAARRPWGSRPLTRKPSPGDVSRETPEGPRLPRAALFQTGRSAHAGLDLHHEPGRQTRGRPHGPRAIADGNGCPTLGPAARGVRACSRESHRQVMFHVKRSKAHSCKSCPPPDGQVAHADWIGHQEDGGRARGRPHEPRARAGGDNSPTPAPAGPTRTCRWAASRKGRTSPIASQRSNLGGALACSARDRRARSTLTSARQAPTENHHPAPEHRVGQCPQAAEQAMRRRLQCGVSRDTSARRHERVVIVVPATAFGVARRSTGHSSGGHRVPPSRPQRESEHRGQPLLRAHESDQGHHVSRETHARWRPDLPRHPSHPSHPRRPSRPATHAAPATRTTSSTRMIYDANATPTERRRGRPSRAVRYQLKRAREDPLPHSDPARRRTPPPEHRTHGRERPTPRHRHSYPLQRGPEPFHVKPSAAPHHARIHPPAETA